MKSGLYSTNNVNELACGYAIADSDEQQMQPVCFGNLALEFTL